jgi:hypothetical protein
MCSLLTETGADFWYVTYSNYVYALQIVCESEVSKVLRWAIACLHVLDIAPGNRSFQ